MATDELALAAAGIDNQADAQRQFRLAGEELNLLSNTVFKDFEIIAAKPRDKLAFGKWPPLPFPPLKKSECRAKCHQSPLVNLFDGEDQPY